MLTGVRQGTSCVLITVEIAGARLEVNPANGGDKSAAVSTLSPR